MYKHKGFFHYELKQNNFPSVEGRPEILLELFRWLAENDEQNWKRKVDINKQREQKNPSEH